MRNAKLDAIAIEEIEEALSISDSDFASVSDIRTPVDENDLDDADEIGLRRLYERPEVLSASLQHRLGLR